jgi:hypothetical protein
MKPLADHHLPRKGSALVTQWRPVAKGAPARGGTRVRRRRGIPRVRIRNRYVADPRHESNVGASSLNLDRRTLALCLRHSRPLQAGALEPPLDSIAVEVGAKPTRTRDPRASGARPSTGGSRGPRASSPSQPPTR